MTFLKYKYSESSTYPPQWDFRGRVKSLGSSSLQAVLLYPGQREEKRADLLHKWCIHAIWILNDTAAHNDKCSTVYGIEKRDGEIRPSLLWYKFAQQPQQGEPYLNCGGNLIRQHIGFL